jgi:HJR/Mrr/RecB family endonuclease
LPIIYGHRVHLHVNHWIFQCNPKRFDLERALARSPDINWNAPLQRSEIAVGDRVWLAIVGQRDPGIHYLATITSPPYTVPEDEFGRWRTGLHFEYRLDPFLSRVEVLDDPVLGRITAFRGFQGTNRLISLEAGQRLEALAHDRLQPLASAQPRGIPPPDLDVGRSIERHTAEVRRRLKEEIRKLSPREFELLVVRVLGELDFEVEHVGQTRDGGVDAEAVLSLRGLTAVHTMVQAKRWGRTLGSRVVRELRGALRTDERGLIITSSDFSSEAREEAQAEGKARIGLLSGDELVTLCLERGIGVTTRRILLYDLDVAGLKGEAADAG